MITKEDVMEAIKPIQDPEIFLGIVDLGLIYDVQVRDLREVTNPATGESIASGDEPQTEVYLKMTYTTPACPYGPMLKQQIEQTVARLPGVKQTKIEVVFIPPWDPRTHASEDVKAQLGIWD